MHLSSPNCLDANLNLTHGLHLPFVLSGLLSVMLKTSGNVLTLPVIGPLSSPYVTAITVLFSQLKTVLFQASTSSSDNPCHLWQTVNKLLHCRYSSPLPSYTSASSLADSFASFFTDNISKLRLSLVNNSSSVSPHLPSPSNPPSHFSTFCPATESEISKILFSCPSSSFLIPHLNIM